MTQARATSGIREQLFNAFTSDRRDNAKLGKMGTDRIAHRGLLPNEQMPRAMQQQTTLLLRRLGLDKPHVGSANGFADRLSVGGIVLLPLDVGLDVGRRHQGTRWSAELATIFEQLFNAFTDQ